MTGIAFFVYGPEVMRISPPPHWKVANRVVLSDRDHEVDWDDMQQLLTEGRNVLWIRRTLPRIRNLPQREKNRLRLYTERFLEDYLVDPAL